jgi:hypothetical protein
VSIILWKYLEFEGSLEDYGQTARWQNEMEAQLQLQDEEDAKIMMELRYRKQSNGSAHHTPTNGSVGNGRAIGGGGPIFQMCNGNNNGHYERESEQRSDVRSNI